MSCLRSRPLDSFPSRKTLLQLDQLMLTLSCDTLPRMPSQLSLRLCLSMNIPFRRQTFVAALGADGTRRCRPSPFGLCQNGRAVGAGTSSMFSEQIKGGEDGSQAVVAPFRAARRAVRPVVCGKCQHLFKQRMVLQVNKLITSLPKRDL